MYKPLWRSYLHQRQSRFVRCQSAFTNRPKTVPIGKQENNKNPNCKPFKMHWSSTEILHNHRWNEWKCSGCFWKLHTHISDNLQIQLGKEQKKERIKSKWKVSKQNRLRGSWNLRSVTWTSKSHISLDLDTVESWYIFLGKAFSVLSLVKLDLTNSNLTFRPSSLLSMHVDTEDDLDASNCHRLSATQHALLCDTKGCRLRGGQKNISALYSGLILALFSRSSI